MTTERMHPRVALLLGEIPDEERVQFEQYYAQRLGAALRAANAQVISRALGSADPDQVERDLIDQLIREAEGRDDPDGLGLVPTAENENFIVPPDSDPRLNSQRRRGGKPAAAPENELGRGRIALGVALLLIPIIWFAFSVIGMTQKATPTQAEQVATTTTPQPFSDMPIADEKNIAAWYPASLEIVDGDGQGNEVYRTVASPNTLGSNWSPTLEDGVAAWLPNTYINSIFCLPPSVHDRAAHFAGRSIHIRTVNGDMRDYTITRVRTVARQQVEVLDQRHAGLTLLICGTSGEERTIAEAQFRPATVPQVFGSVGQVQQAPNGLRALVSNVVLTTTANLPPDHAALDLTVTLTNTGRFALTNGDLVAQFDLDGQLAEAIPIGQDLALAASGQRQQTLRYLVPRGGGNGTWRLTASDGATIAVRVPVAPFTAPTSQHATLQASDVTRQIIAGVPVLTLTVHVAATGAAPLILAPEDVAVSIDDQPVTLRAESSPLPLRIAPGSVAPLTLMVQAPSRTTFIVRVGPQRWQITLPALEGGDALP